MAAENKKTKRLYLEDQMSHKSNNLDLMKFLAAWLVIVHHSFDLNVSNGEWIKVITGGQLDFGTMAVSLFFLASGLFIAKSVERVQTAGKFFKARFRRVWPPLAAVVVLSVIMGAFITTLSPGAYVSNSITWRYLLNAVFVLQHGLPGVFEHNVYGSAVNGALWTLPVEVACYVACFIVYKLGLLKKKRIIGVMALYLVCAVAGYRICTMLGIGLLISAFRPIYFFLLGHVLYVYRDGVPVDWRLFVLSLVGMAVCFALVDGGCLDLLSVCASLSGIYGETVWQQTCLWGTFFIYDLSVCLPDPAASDPSVRWTDECLSAYGTGVSDRNSSWRCITLYNGEIKGVIR